MHLARDKKGNYVELDRAGLSADVIFAFAAQYGAYGDNHDYIRVKFPDDRDVSTFNLPGLMLRLQRSPLAI